MNQPLLASDCYPTTTTDDYDDYDLIPLTSLFHHSLLPDKCEAELRLKLTPALVQLLLVVLVLVLPPPQKQGTNW